MPEMKKAGASTPAKRNTLQPESYHRRSEPSTKIRIGEILFACLQDAQRPGTWQEIEELLRRRWSGPPISAVKTNATTANLHATQVGFKPGQAGTSNWSDVGEKINPDEDKTFSGCEISAGVNS